MTNRDTFLLSAVVSDAALAASGILLNGVAFQGLFNSIPLVADVTDAIEVEKAIAVASGAVDLAQGLEFIAGNIRRYGVPDNDNVVTWEGSGVTVLSAESEIDNLPADKRILKSWNARVEGINAQTVQVFGGFERLVFNGVLNSSTPINFENGDSNIAVRTKQGSDLMGNIRVSGVVIDRKTGARTPGSELLGFDKNSPDLNITRKVFGGQVIVTTQNINATRVDVSQAVGLRNGRENFRVRRLVISAKSTDSAVSLQVKLFRLRENGRQDITGETINFGGLITTVPGKRFYKATRQINEGFTENNLGLYVDIVAGGLWEWVDVAVDYEDI